MRITVLILLLNWSCQKILQEKPSEQSQSLMTGSSQREKLKENICNQFPQELKPFIEDSLKIYLDPKHSEQLVKENMYNWAIESTVVPDIKGFDKVLDKYPASRYRRNDWTFFYFNREKAFETADLRVYLKPKSTQDWNEIASRLFNNVTFMQAFGLGKHISTDLKDKFYYERLDYVCLSLNTKKTDFLDLVSAIHEATQGRVVAEDHNLGTDINPGTYMLPVIGDLSKVSPTDFMLQTMMTEFKKMAPKRDPCLPHSRQKEIIEAVAKKVFEEHIKLPICRK